MGKVDDMRAMREARYGRSRDRRPVGLVSREPVMSKPITKARTPKVVRTSTLVDSSPALGTMGALYDSVESPSSASSSVGANRVEQTLEGLPRPIHSYSSEELDGIVADLYSPGMTCEQMIDAVVIFLGFQRRGKIIKVRVKEAYDTVIHQS